jgi:hypothetical protein
VEARVSPLDFEPFNPLASGIETHQSSKHPLSKLKIIKPEQFVEESFIGYSRKEYPEYEAWIEKVFNSLGRIPSRIAEEY